VPKGPAKRSLTVFAHVHTLQPEGLEAVSQLQLGVQIKYVHTNVLEEGIAFLELQREDRQSCSMDCR